MHVNAQTKKEERPLKYLQKKKRKKQQVFQETNKQTNKQTKQNKTNNLNREFYIKQTQTEKKTTKREQKHF